MKQALIIAVAPNGARKTKQELPQIPLSAGEIAQTTRECRDAGASMIHLHVRDANGQHSLDVSLYQQAIDEINRITDASIFIQVTSEAVGIYSPEQQFDMIHKLKPPAVSIGLREIKRLGRSKIRQNFEFMRANNILPQLILYSENDLILYKKWLKEQTLPGKSYPILLVIGKKQPEGNLEYGNLTQNLVDNLETKNWMVCGFGQNEFKTAVKAAELGGNIRLGFENNHLLENQIKANSNAELIQQMVDHLKKKEIYTRNYNETLDLMRPDW